MFLCEKSKWLNPLYNICKKCFFNSPNYTFWSYFLPYFTCFCTVVVSSDRFLQQVFIIIIIIILEERAFLFPYIYYQPANAGLLHITRHSVEAISVCAAQSAAIQALNGQRYQQQPLSPLFKAWKVYSAQLVRSNDGANTLNPSSRSFFFTFIIDRQHCERHAFEWKDLKDGWKILCIVNRGVTPPQMRGGSWGGGAPGHCACKWNFPQHRWGHSHLACCASEVKSLL